MQGRRGGMDRATEEEVEEKERHRVDAELAAAMPRRRSPSKVAVCGRLGRAVASELAR